MYLFIKKHWVGIVLAIVIIALLFLGNIDAIKAIVTGWNSSIVVAITSAFIAVCALGVTVWQGRQNYKHNKLSVLPLLRFEGSNSKGDGTGYVGHYEFNIVNRGIGPAIIKTFILFSEDKKDSYNDYHAYTNFLNEMIKDFKNRNQSYLGRGSVLGNGEVQTLWEFNYDPDNQKIEDIEKLIVYVEYQSIYQDEIIPLYHEQKPQISQQKFS